MFNLNIKVLSWDYKESSSLGGLGKESIQYRALFGNSVRFISLFSHQTVFIIVPFLLEKHSLGL